MGNLRDDFPTYIGTSVKSSKEELERLKKLGLLRTETMKYRSPPQSSGPPKASLTPRKIPPGIPSELGIFCIYNCGGSFSTISRLLGSLGRLMLGWAFVLREGAFRRRRPLVAAPMRAVLEGSSFHPYSSHFPSPSSSSTASKVLWSVI